MDLRNQATEIKNNIKAIPDVYLDKLTQLPNQAYFESRAQEKVDQLLAKGETADLIFFDIIGMKLYNTTNGYEQGDLLLSRVADILREVFQGGLISHLGADHYGVITADEDIESKFEKVRSEVALAGVSKIDINAGIRRIAKTAHVNVAAVIDRAKLACDAIRWTADQSYRFYDEELEKQISDQKFVNDNIDKAIANGEIQVYYQPVIRTLNRQLCGYEALARWISPDWASCLHSDSYRHWKAPIRSTSWTAIWLKKYADSTVKIWIMDCR